MNIVFMGTPEFSVPTLEKIINSGKHKVLEVFTKPDKVNKRGNKVEFSYIKKSALAHGIPIFQPEKLKTEEVGKHLLKLNPDLILVVAYGKILPKNILDLPKFGCINLHGSILPKYRGSAPIQRAVMAGETETGVTTMFMDEEMDTGDVLLTERIKIDAEDTASSLFKKLSFIGADLVLETLDLLKRGKIIRTRQKEENATYAPPLSKEEAKIDWQKNDAVKVNNIIRAMDAGPAAYTTLRGKRIKIFKSKVKNMNQLPTNCVPGQVANLSPLTICCNDGTYLEILKLQPENKKMMDAEEFTRGNKILGEVLGK